VPGILANIGCLSEIGVLVWLVTELDTDLGSFISTL
jgi:hypothetical protein